MTLYLHGLGHFHPENEITNRFLEELDIGTDDDWILERVGIRSRRTMRPLDYIREARNRDPREALEAAEVSNAQTAAAAAQMGSKSGWSRGVFRPIQGNIPAAHLEVPHFLISSTDTSTFTAETTNPAFNLSG